MLCLSHLLNFITYTIVGEEYSPSMPWNKSIRDETIHNSV
jgi:hypothetical protein